MARHCKLRRGACPWCADLGAASPGALLPCASRRPSEPVVVLLVLAPLLLLCVGAAAASLGLRSHIASSSA